MGQILSLGARRREFPRPPAWLAEEAELFARKSGRNGTVRMVPTLMRGDMPERWTWVIDLTLRPNDPRMLAWKEGRAEQPPKETIWLHRRNPIEGKEIPGTYGLREPPYVGLDIHQEGADGIRRFLEEGDTWNGRGKFGSVTDAAKSVSEHNARERARVKEEAREENRAKLKQERRSWVGIPLVQAGIDLTKKLTKKEK